MELWIVAIFTLGFSIFYSLSLIEKRVWPIIFKDVRASVSEADIRFTHEALKRLTPLLPPSNGVVILIGTTLLILQSAEQSWSLESLSIPVFYILMMAGIVLIGKNPSVVFAIRRLDQDSPIQAVTQTIRTVGIHHHIALVTNLAVVLLQIFLIN